MAGPSEWALVRVEERNKDEPYWPGPFREAGAVGKQVDRAHCLFCGMTFAAKVEYVRAHAAGVSGIGVQSCKGVKRHDEEGDDNYAERQKQYEAAKKQMLAKIAAGKEAKADEGTPCSACTQWHALSRSKPLGQADPRHASPRAASKRLLAEKTSGAPPAKKARLSVGSWLDRKSEKEEQAQKKADESLALAFMVTGTAPHVLDNPHMQAALQDIAQVGGKYKPPGRRTVSGRLAKAHRARVAALIHAKQERCKRGGWSVTSDGAQNKKAQPVVVVVKVQGGQSELLTAVNASGETKDAEWTANQICDQIEAQPVPTDCVAVHQDNATRKSWAIIEQRCPWVACCACWAHVLDLLLKDIAKLPYIKQMFKEAAKMRMFLKNKQAVLARLRHFSPNRALVSPGATRFRSSYIGLDSVARMEQAIRQTMVDKTVSEYVTKYKGQKTIAREGEDDHDKETLMVRFKSLQTLALDEAWWHKMASIKAVLDPIARLQAMVDGNAPMASKMYFDMYLVHEAVGKVPNLPLGLVKTVQDLVTTRWDYGLSAINLAGNVLDPEYWDCIANEECMNGFNEMVDKTFWLPNEPASNASPEAQEAYKLVRDKQLKNRSRAVSQLPVFKGRTGGLFNRPTCAEHAATLSMYDWWLIYGAGVPELQAVALRVGCQVASQSSSERVFKDMNAVLDDTRNRMSWDKAHDILYVRSAIRLLDAVESMDYSLKVIPDAGGWDDDAEAAAEDEAAGPGASAAIVIDGNDSSDADGSDADVDEPTDDMEAEEEEPDADTAPNHTAGLLGPVADRLERMVGIAASRITPCDELPPADAQEREERAARCRRRPKRFDE